MRKKYTPSDLILFLYGETVSYETVAIKRQLITDFSLNEELKAFTTIKTRLNEFSKKPSQSSVNIIMNYSRKTRELETTC